MRDSRVRVLLVGGNADDYQQLAATIALIKRQDYLLSWCEQLDQALLKLGSGEVDVALLDCPTAQQPTRDLIGKTREAGISVPFIAMTCDDPHDLTTPQDNPVEGVEFLAKDDIKPYLLDRYLRDAVSREQMNRQLREYNRFDPLTGLPNRLEFRQQLDRMVEKSRQQEGLLGLLLINLDGFKRFNESFGHDAGDQLVATMATRISQCVRKSDLVARVGGDEFALILDDGNQRQDIDRVADKVIEALIAPVDVDGHPVMLSVSIGVAEYPETGSSAELLLKHATMALLEAKQERGCKVCHYSEQTAMQQADQNSMEEEIRRGLRRGEFELFYQPRVDLVSGDTVGMEGLIRWRHPERGLVPPNVFIPVAEETGLIVPMGYWIIQQACEDMLQLDEQGLTHLDIAINLSFKQLQDKMFVDTATRIIQQSGIDATRLEFELTETAIMSNYQQTYDGMLALNKLGITFSLDDFGTGFSSFAHIQRLPIAALKIDRSFMRSVIKDSEDAIIVKAMVNLAHSLNLRVVAEGVETLEQVQFLWQNHCDLVQGFYFSPAVPMKDFTLMINQRASMVV